MGHIGIALKKLWLAQGNKPAMTGSDWCKDWREKHPGNCEGCPQEQNCHDYVEMLAEMSRGGS